MVRKPPSELTKHESQLLTIAAKLMCAMKRVEDTLTSSKELEYMDGKIKGEIQAIQTIFNTYRAGSKMPHLHPIIQVVGAEWKNAEDQNRSPNWPLLTTQYITQLCETVLVENPEWHESLSSLQLNSYLEGLHPTKLWWLEAHPEVQKTSDAAIENISLTSVAIPSPLPPPSPPLPSHTHNTRGKGKARAIQEPMVDPSAPSNPPYALRGTKRCADLDIPEGESNSSTPRKSNVPWVEVEQASPPRPTQCQRIEASAVITYGKDQCGPCGLADVDECQAQSNTQSISCVCCTIKHKHGLSLCTVQWKRGPVAQGPLVHPKCSEHAHTLINAHITLVAIGDSRVDALEQRMDALESMNRDTNEKVVRILLEIQNVRQDSHDTHLMAGRLLDVQGIDPTSIPGVGGPPSNHRSISPSIASASSVGARMSGLGISDARSTSSYSSAPSEHCRQPSGGSVEARVASGGRLTPSGVSGRSSSASAVA
ncbi:hypothetical protein EDB89DRAFT_1908385 [Lactarius sanguifluus]|nr:hypothetical protein EDB89DRAFT_1908385 [Lactarius sanguifluus]